jgi:Protein of unknown function (DUF2786)
MWANRLIARILASDVAMTSRPASDVPESLVQRVRKLLDKAEATTNVHEAEAFSQKAAQLVALHRISPERLEAVGRGDGELGIVEINVGRGAYVRARLALLAAVSEPHDVRVVYQATPAGTIGFAAGFRRDLDVVEMLYESLHQQASAQMAEIKRGSGGATQRYRRSFLFGFADRVGQILAEAKAGAEEAVVQAQASSTALAIRERREEVDGYVRESWGRVRAAAAPSSVGPDGWHSGAKAAERADVGRKRVGGRRGLGRGRR